MLYKFKSEVTADLIMFETVGRRILEILGKDPKRGILHVEEMSDAITKIKKAVAQDDEYRNMMEKILPGHAQDPLDNPDAIALHQRCVPFVDMLAICIKYKADVVWGV